MLEDLLRPFGYLNVQHETRLPQYVNWVLPLVISFLITTCFGYYEIKANVFGATGLIDRALSFIQTLTGFYMAGLAAISSFNNPSMDTPMPGVPPKMKVRYNGQLSTVDATRRRFMSSMFAFLTASSFLITLFSITLLVFAEPMKSALPLAIQPCIKLAVLFAYLFAVVQMIVITFWGLYYMGERMLTPD